jgi:methylated-DNA-[protein]-cysteine S-methyltransferase
MSTGVDPGENGDVMELARATMDTPVGPVSLTCSDTGLAGVSFRGSRPAAPGRSAGGGLLRAARDQLTEYFSGQRRAFDLPIDWSVAAAPQQQVLSVLLDTVGYGETITYGSLARRAGLGEGGPDRPAQAVGTIMGSNPWPLVVPCHRVVAGTGLGGYSGGSGIEIKRWLLIFEGALPATLDWDPARGYGV